MKKVFLEELPRNFKGVIWKECVGRKIKFVYDEIEGYVEVVNFEKGSLLTIKYKDRIKKMKSCDFIKCKLGVMLGVLSNDFLFDIGESVRDDGRSMIITDLKRIKGNNGKSKRCYEYKCDKCGYIGIMAESQLIRGVGCSCCANRIAVLGINTIWDTHKWLVDDFGLDEEFAKTHTYGTNEKGLFTCKYCGNKLFKTITKVIRDKTIACFCDSNGFSYPEKFLHCLLKQLDLTFISEANKSLLNWCEGKRYDFYMPEYNMIIETHGMQHYEEVNRGRTLQEEQENDRIKRELALENGIEYYIELDCRKSDLEYIKIKIMESELSRLFDLSKIDWLKCEEFAISNIYKNICDIRGRNPNYSTVKIQEITGYDYQTVRNALIRGNRLGWCYYDPKEERDKALKYGRLLKRKEVEIFQDGKSLGIFDSCASLLGSCVDLFGVQFSQSGVSAVCRGIIKKHKGYVFKYVNSKQI